MSKFTDIVEKIKLLIIDVDYKDIYAFAVKTGIKLDTDIYSEIFAKINANEDAKSTIAINLASHWDHGKYQWRPEEMRE